MLRSWVAFWTVWSAPPCRRFCRVAIRRRWSWSAVMLDSTVELFASCESADEAAHSKFDSDYDVR